MENAAEIAGQTADVAGYTISQSDVDALMGLATSISLELFVVIALLLLVAGLVFGGIATRFWLVR